MKSVFITGIGSGLGRALAQHYLESGYRVFALSRRLPEEFRGAEGFRFERCDLADLENVKSCCARLLEGVDSLDIVWLNAGVLTPLKDMPETPLYEFRQMMDVNVWANKLIMDFFIESGVSVRQVIAISSGASVNGNRGWHGYSVSKAALNMLVKLYAREMEGTHLLALAPGLIATPMLEEFVLNADSERFPSVARIKSAPKFSPKEAVENILSKMDKLLTFESGSYVDVRKVNGE